MKNKHQLRQIKNQQGAALIVALLVVALVVVISTSMAASYIVTVKRASNQLLSEQAYSYLRGAEALAMKVLRMDLKLDVENGQAVDNCGEFWAEESPPMLLEEGAYGGRIHDLQGRFNINNLRGARAGLIEIPVDINQARFIRLLLSFEELELDLTEDDARNITWALLDWLDTDRETLGFAGAEDEYYESLEGRLPHRAANREMVDISELLLVAHMPPKLYRALLPHVTVWPLKGGEININTATDKVLRTLNVPQKNKAAASQMPLRIEDVEQGIAQQLTGGFEQVEDLRAQSGFDNIDLTGLSVSSDYFMLNGDANIGGLKTRLYSVISRKNGTLQVIYRSTSKNSEIRSCAEPVQQEE